MPATPFAASCPALRRDVPRAEFARSGALALLFVTAPAYAEPGFELSAANDDRFRGESISGERPIVTASMSYDDDDGFYAGLSGTVVATRDKGVRPLRSIQYAGYVQRVSGNISIDVGVTNRVYSRFFTGEYARTFTEGYVGLVGRRVSAHLFLSPDFDGRGGRSAYLGLDALLLERGRWSLAGHAGLQLPPDAPDEQRKPTPDWRLEATRRQGRLAVSLQWVGHAPDEKGAGWRQGAVLAVRRSF